MRKKIRINVSVPEGVRYGYRELTEVFEECLHNVICTPGKEEKCISGGYPYRGVFKFRNSIYVDPATYSTVKRMTIMAGVGMAEMTFRIFLLGFTPLCREGGEECYE